MGSGCAKALNEDSGHQLANSHRPPSLLWSHWGDMGTHPWSQSHATPAGESILLGCPGFALLSGTLGEKKIYIHIYFPPSPLKISGLFNMRAFYFLKTAAAFI